MTIWCAVIIVIGLILMGALIGFGIAVGGVVNNNTWAVALMKDEEWNMYVERTTGMAMKYVSDSFGSMFKD